MYFSPYRRLSLGDLAVVARRTRLRRGVSGLGAAPCPSLEQLQGVDDPNDPCQSPLASLPFLTPAQAAASGSIWNPSVIPVSVSGSMPSWVGPAALVIGGILLFKVIAR